MAQLISDMWAQMRATFDSGIIRDTVTDIVVECASSLAPCCSMRPGACCSTVSRLSYLCLDFCAR
jgi:hypothetical protein